MKTNTFSGHVIKIKIITCMYTFTNLRKIFKRITINEIEFFEVSLLLLAP